MAQRWRSLQSGVSLLLHHTEATTSGRLASTCSSATSLLQQLQQDQHEQRNTGSHQPPLWGYSAGVRHLSFWSRSATPAPKSTSDESTTILAETADLTPPAPPDFWPLPESDGASLEVATAITAACDALERASIMAAKADAWFAASWCISGLQEVHEALGLPWYLSIAVFNISLRILTFPLMVLGQKSTARLMEFNHNLIHAKKLQEAAMKATSQQEHDRLMRAFRAEYTAQTSKHGSPLKALTLPAVMITNGFVFLSIFNGINKLMAAKVPSLTTGGALWFSDLTESDPFFGLPIMCTLVTLAMVEYGLSMTGDMGPMPMERQQAQKSLKWVFRGLAFMFIPAGGYVAAGTAVLWVSNTTFGVFQGLLLRNDKFRKRVGLPSMQALRDMNAAVVAANSDPAPGTGPAPASAVVAAGAPEPAVNSPLLKHPVKGAGVPGKR